MDPQSPQYLLLQLKLAQTFEAPSSNAQIILKLLPEFPASAGPLAPTHKLDLLAQHYSRASLLAHFQGSKLLTKAVQEMSFAHKNSAEFLCAEIMKVSLSRQI